MRLRTAGPAFGVALGFWSAVCFEGRGRAIEVVLGSRVPLNTERNSLLAYCFDLSLCILCGCSTTCPVCLGQRSFYVFYATLKKDLGMLSNDICVRIFFVIFINVIFF